MLWERIAEVAVPVIQMSLLESWGACQANFSQAGGYHLETFNEHSWWANDRTYRCNEV